MLRLLFMNTINNGVDVNNIVRPGLSMNDRNRYRSNPEPSGFRIGPTVILGGLLGLGNAAAQNKLQEEIASLPVFEPDPEPVSTPKKEWNQMMRNGPEITGNFYKDTQNIINNLNVNITPIGVSYTLKHKGYEVGIDTIETSEMDQTMRRAWMSKDVNYFRNLMLMKIYSESKLAEQAFAGKLVVKQSNTAKRMKAKKMIKKASDGEEQDDYVEEPEEVLWEDLNLSFMDLDNFVQEVADELQENEKLQSVYEKLAEEVAEESEDFFLDLTFPRPFEKYASLVEPGEEKLAFRPMGMKTGKNKLCNFRYLKKNLNVGFMPDRVMFVADNQLVGALPAHGMNEDGYEHFIENDTKYFKDFFMQEAKKGLDVLKGAEKLAAESDEQLETLTAKEAFLSANIHPLIYYDLLMKQYGEVWIDVEAQVLIRLIEQNFTDGEPINQAALNKVLSLQAVNKAELVYTSMHAFEKVVRSFSSKPIDFERKESEDISVVDLAFGIDVLQKSTTHTDIYGVFSPDVIQYIADTVAARDVYGFYPQYPGVPTLFQDAFELILNSRIADSLRGQKVQNLSNAKLESQIKKSIGEIATALQEFVYTVKDEKKDTLTFDEKTFEKCSSKLSDTDKTTLKLQVNLFYALNAKMVESEASYQRQRRQLELTGGDAT